jgi:DNA-binding NarL/FixJ family response regulator
VRTTRTLIVDDNARFRWHVREILASEPDIEVIGEADDGQEAILRARALKPDLVLMDVRMPRMNGITATRRLKDEMPETRVIILTVFDSQEYGEAAMACGANGYVVKEFLFEELLPAIRGVLGGGT